jgi:RNA polymerase sigma-70 factor (ECF subfamily)
MTHAFRDACQPEGASFELLYQRHAPALYAFFLRAVGDAHDAEDLTATTFSKALQSLGRYHEQGRLAAWLWSIARHTLQDARRRSRPQADLALVAPILADPAPTPDVQTLRDEQARLLGELLAELPADQREALLLRFYAELRPAEIAPLMGRSVGSIKMLIQRALAGLRERYRRAEECACEMAALLLASVLPQAPAPRPAYRVAVAYRRSRR